MKGHWQRHGYIHCAWIVTILGAIIVWLVVQKPDSEELQEFFNFAAAVASLFLAVVAIFYSMISTQDQSTLLQTTRDAADRVDSASVTLGSTSNEIRGLISELGNRFDTIPASVRELQVDLSKKFDQFSESKAHSSGSIESSEPVQISNIGAHLCLYALAKMYKTGKAIDTDALKSAGVDSRFCDLLFGFMSCMSTFRPCDSAISSAGSSFLAYSMGKMPVDEYLALDEAAIPSFAKTVKADIDKHFQVETVVGSEEQDEAK